MGFVVSGVRRINSGTATPDPTPVGSGPAPNLETPALDNCTPYRRARAHAPIDTALGAYYRRMCARMDNGKAVTAAAHKLDCFVELSWRA